MFLNKDISMPTVLGPVRVLRPTFPNCPLTGLVNAAGLNHSARVLPPGGVVGTPRTRFGRASPPVLEKSVMACTVNGVPVVNELMPMNCQFPKIHLAAAFIFG